MTGDEVDDALSGRVLCLEIGILRRNQRCGPVECLPGVSVGNGIAERCGQIGQQPYVWLDLDWSGICCVGELAGSALEGFARAGVVVRVDRQTEFVDEQQVRELVAELLDRRPIGAGEDRGPHGQDDGDGGHGGEDPAPASRHGCHERVAASARHLKSATPCARPSA